LLGESTNPKMNMVFGRFDFTPETRELRRDGRPVRLQAQPGKVLAVLMAHAGEIVTRETLQREVWGGETHVDFERGLNYCIAQIRSALGDNAESPRYIETVPKQGYRFIAPLVAQLAPEAAGRPAWRAVAATLLLLVLVSGALAVTIQREDSRPTIAVIPFYNETGRPDLDQVAKAISDATVARLATPERIGKLSVIGNAAALRNPFARTDVQEAARAVGAEWILIGQLKADPAALRVIGHLIRVSDMKHVWAQTFDDPTFALDAQGRTAESIAANIARTTASD
jgi:DNA-binding winged helix-turn-helix (wHTH) protein/TolB-like protein